MLIYKFNEMYSLKLRKKNQLFVFLFLYLLLRFLLVFFFIETMRSEMCLFVPDAVERRLQYNQNPISGVCCNLWCLFSRIMDPHSPPLCL